MASNVQSNISTRRKAMRWSLSGSLLLFTAVGMYMYCASKPLVAAEDPLPPVSGAHWVKRVTRFLPEGKTTTQIVNGWYKLPDKLRIEDEYQVIVRNGARWWNYNKQDKTYGVGESPDHPTRYSVEVFTPNWDIKQLRNLGAQVSVHETEATLNGAKYPAVEVSSPKFQTKSGIKIGSQSILAYLDCKTKLIKVMDREKRDFASDALLSKETVEYDYASDLPPDDFFVFVPPPEAKLRPSK